jgi:hypothetical protein
MAGCFLFPREDLYPSVSLLPCIGTRPIVIFTEVSSEYGIDSGIAPEFTIEVFKSQEFMIELRATGELK